MDLFVLGSRKHGTDSDQVQILDLQSDRGLPHVGVHQEHAPEESLLSHLVGG